MKIVCMQEEGGTADGYSKQMSQAFIDAEHELFAEQCRDVDVIITTALIPGKTAPVYGITHLTQKKRNIKSNLLFPIFAYFSLILEDHVKSMKPGSVIGV